MTSAQMRLGQAKKRPDSRRGVSRQTKSIPDLRTRGPKLIVVAKKVGVTVLLGARTVNFCRIESAGLDIGSRRYPRRGRKGTLSADL